MTKIPKHARSLIVTYESTRALGLPWNPLAARRAQMQVCDAVDSMRKYQSLLNSNEEFVKVWAVQKELIDRYVVELQLIKDPKVELKNEKY